MNSDKNIKIVIIDSGIDKSKAGLDKFVGCNLRYRLDSYGKVISTEEYTICHEHGTAIAMIIKNICPKVEFISMSILDENLSSDGRLMLYAIKEAINLNPDIIHLSLGTKRPKYRFSLARLMKKAEQSNILVVSALSNDRKKSYPAAIKNVIAVSANFPGGPMDIYYKTGMFYATPGLDGIPGQDELLNRNMMGSSLSAAYMTGYICNKMLQNSVMKPNEMRKYIKKILAIQ